MSESAVTQTTTHDDGKFVRTAIILESGSEGKTGSIDVVNEKGERIALINLFTNDDNTWFAVDVVDKDKRFEQHTAITFHDGTQERIENANGLVAADFRNKE
jgi:hypothetical protein